MDDKCLYKVIFEGGSANGLDNGMPGWKHAIRPEEITSLVAYIRRDLGQSGDR